MTRDLLQSDIDLAKRLIAEGQSDGEIIVALGYRRVGPEKAQRTVRDLRRGIDVIPDPVFEAPPTNGFGPQEEHAGPVPAASETAGASRASEVMEDTSLKQAVAETNPRVINPPFTQAARGKGSVGSVPWFRFALLGIIGISLAAVFFLNRKSETTVRATAPASDLMVQPQPNLRRHVLKVEIEPPEVQVCGIPLFRENALEALSGLAGMPSRTNRTADVTIYAFDQSGVLLYTENQTGKNSLLLYFESVGGTNGAQNAFTGTLAIRKTEVTNLTESKGLAKVPGLEISETAKSVFSGQCNGLSVSFAYLKTPERLSLVQIDMP